MNIFRSLIDYLKSAKDELAKVTWPSRKDTIRYSGLVIVVSIVVAAFFATLDFGLGKIVDAALSGQTVPAQEQELPVDINPIVEPEVNVTPGLDFSGEALPPSDTENGQ